MDAAERAIGVEQVRAHPGQRAQADDDQQRCRPDHQLERGRVIPFRLVASGRVGLAIAPGEQHRQRHHGDDDQQHQDGGDDDEVALLRCDVAGWRQHDVVAAAERGSQR